MKSFIIACFLCFISHSAFAQERNLTTTLECLSEPEQNHLATIAELERLHLLTVQCARWDYALKAMSLVKQELLIAQQLKNVPATYFQSIYHWQGYIYNRMGEFKLATASLKKALHLSELLHDNKKIYTIRLALSEAYIFLGQYDAAQALLDLNQAVLNETSTPAQTLVLMSAQAVLYRDSKKYAKAENTFLDMLKISRDINEVPREYHRITVPFAALLIQQNKTAQAKTLLDEALSVRLAADSPYRVANVRLYLADIARLESKTTEAKELYEQVLHTYAETVGLKSPYALMAKQKLAYLNTMP